MSEWEAGFAVESVLQIPLDFYDVTYANGQTIRYRKEPKQGEWIWQTEDKYCCSVCGKTTRVEEIMNEPQYNFCPHCGASMVKEGEAD